jgi:hypothetical protein
MARLFTAGAEEGNHEAAKLLWGDSLDYTAKISSFSLITTVPAYVRTGGFAYRPQRIDDGQMFLRKALANPTEIYGGCGVYLGQYATNYDQGFLLFNSLGTKSSIWVSAGGVVNFSYNGTTKASSSAAVLNSGAYHYVEFHLIPHASAGTMTIKVDGTTVINFTAGQTAAVAYVTDVQIMSSGGVNTNFSCIDDFVINDTAGSDNNTYPGQIRLEPIRPTSAGSHTVLTRGGVDRSSNWEQVRDYDNESVVQTTASGSYDLYLSTNVILPSGASITNIIEQVIAKTGTGTSYIGLGVRCNSTESWSAPLSLASGYTALQRALSTDPSDSSAWTQSDITVLELGVKAQ